MVEFVQNLLTLITLLRPRMLNSTAVGLAALVNFSALLFTFPYAWYMTVTSSDTYGSECVESWHGRVTRFSEIQYKVYQIW